MNRTTKIVIAVVAVIAVAAVAFIGIRNQMQKAITHKEGSVRIGANLSLTGGMPYWSTQMKNGLDLAAEKYSKKVKLVYEDNGGMAKNALTAFHKLEQEKVSVIVTAHTSIAQPQQKLADSAHIPLLGTIVGVSDFGEKSPWSFLDWPAHDDVVPPLVDYVKSLNAKTAVTLVVNDDYGRTGAQTFAKYFKNVGGKIIAEEEIANSEMNINPILSRLLAKKVDVLYTIAREETLLSIIKRANEMGFKGHIVGDHAMASSVIAKGLPNNVEIIFGGSAGIAEIEKTAPEFVASYKTRFGEKPDWVALYGYSIGEYLFPLAIEAKGSCEKLRELLSRMQKKTIRGELVMAGNRKVNTKGLVYIRKGGVLTIAKYTPKNK